MRRYSILAALTVLNFATATLGLPILTGGKFSISNLGPILFILICAPIFFVEEKSVDRRVITFLLAFNVSAVLSFVIFLIRFRWEPNFPVLFFQDVELVFSLLLIWYGRRDYEGFRRAVRAGIYASFPVIAYFGWADYSAHEWQWSFGMDDRSHTAVLFCCEAFILIRLYGRKMDLIAAVALSALSLLTVSREVAFFVPAILVALVARSKFGVALAAAAVGGLAAAFWVLGDAMFTLVHLFGRLSSFEAAEGGSTPAHLLLLASAVQMKFSDFWMFLFGGGPENFSKALTTFQTLLPQIRAIDPALAEGAQIGRAPMHSVPLSLLLDMSLPIFLLCLYFLLKALRFILSHGTLADMLFAFGLLGASTFYSLHNKAYIYLVVATLVVHLPAALQRESRQESATASAEIAPPDLRPSSP